MLFIAFGHEKNVGKSTAGRLMVTYLRTQTHGMNIKVFSFAWEIKTIAHRLYAWAGIHSPQFYEDHPDRKEDYLSALGRTVREIWIFIGMRMRELYEHTWIDFLWNNITCDVMVITDMRFPNEADRILQHGGFVFKMTRPSVPHTSDEADDPLLTYTRWTDQIINDGTLKELNINVINLCRQWIIPQLVKSKSEPNDPSDPVWDSTGGEKLCPRCEAVLPYSIYICPKCGYTWP